MRREYDIRQREQLFGHMRFMREHVEARAQPTRDELRDERGLVDDLAARRVDEARTVPEVR